MASTFGIKVVTRGTVEKVKFESTDMKARAKAYAIAQTHGVGMVYLFKLKKDGFEFVGSIAGIDTPQNSNIFNDDYGTSYGIDSKGRIEIIPQRHVLVSTSVPQWY